MTERESHADYQQEYRSSLLDDDLFDHEDHLPSVRIDDLVPELPKVLPEWLEETRLACLLAGIVGVIGTLVQVDDLSSLIGQPLILNAVILGLLAGYVNVMTFPYVLKYCLVNDLRQAGLLKGLNTFLLVFTAITLLYFLTLPVSGLGLALILVPAPLIFALYSRKYIEKYRPETEGVHFPASMIFGQDLRKLAWLSFISIMILMGGLFFGLLFNFI